MAPSALPTATPTSMGEPRHYANFWAHKQRAREGSRVYQTPCCIVLSYVEMSRVHSSRSCRGLLLSVFRFFKNKRIVLFDTLINQVRHICLRVNNQQTLEYWFSIELLMRFGKGFLQQQCISCVEGTGTVVTKVFDNEPPPAQSLAGVISFHQHHVWWWACSTRNW